jgi:hypothetical protein
MVISDAQTARLLSNGMAYDAKVRGNKLNLKFAAQRLIAIL